MASPDTAKPATSIEVNRLREFEQLGGRLENQDTRSLKEIQASRLNRRFAFSLPVAELIAALHYGEVAQ